MAQNLAAKFTGESARELAALSVDALLAAPMSTLVPPEETRRAVKRVLRAYLSSEASAQTLTRVVEQLANELRADGRALKELTTPDVKRVLREVLLRPYSPDRKLVLTVIDREPMRRLVREIVVSTVNEFAARATAPVAGLTKGLGSLAKLAGESVKARGGMVGALVGGVEKQMEQRSVEFADSVLSKIFGQLADAVADPDLADEAAELRAAAFDGVLELTLPQLSRELVNLDVPGGAKVLREGLLNHVDTTAFDELLTRASALFEKFGSQRPASEVLAEVGLLDVVREVTVESFSRHIEIVAATPAFAAWLEK